MRNEDLDRLFKDKLGASRPAYNPDAWKRMAALLDRQARPVAAWYWQYSAAILALGFLIYGLHWQLATPEAALNKPKNPSITNEVKGKGAPFPLPISASDEGGFPFKNPLQPAGNITGKNKSTLAASTDSPASWSHSSSRREKDSPSSISINAEGKKSRPEAPHIAVFQFPAAYRGLSITELIPHRELISSPDRDTAASPKVDDGNKPLPSPKYSHQLWISAGPSTGQRFTEAQEHSVRGIHAGAQYQFGISSSVSFSLGAHYRRIDKLQIVTEDDTTLFSNQGREDIRTERNFRTLQLISVPLKVHYHWKGRHRLSLGLYLNYALAQSMEMKQTTKTPKSSLSVARDEITGMHDEFKRWNTGLTAGYHFYLTPRLTAGLRFRYGLDDLTQPRAHRDIASKNRLWQGDFVLGYRLF